MPEPDPHRGQQHLRVTVHDQLGVAILKCVAMEAFLRARGIDLRGNTEIARTDKARTDIYDCVANAMDNYYKSLRKRVKKQGADPDPIIEASPTVIGWSTRMGKKLKTIAKRAGLAVPSLAPEEQAQGRPRVDGFGPHHR